MPAGAEQPSKSAVDRAGELLRRLRSEHPPDPFSVGRAYEVLADYRRGWAGELAPITTVNMGLRSMARTLGIDAQVSQRLKRTNRIVDKLARHPTMRLSQMEDIGGCRAVVPGTADLGALHNRVVVTWADELARPITDYVASPKPSGYRAVHVVVRKHGYLVEVQLRTDHQHRWAAAFEQLEAVVRENLRDRGDDPEFADLVRDLANDLALSDRGRPFPQAAIDELRGRLHAERRSR